MKKNIVLHSTDPYLLMRAFIDLQMTDGFKYDKKWNDEYNPFNKPNVQWLMIYSIDNSIELYGHTCSPAEVITLTEQNYIQTLSKLIK